MIPISTVIITLNEERIIEQTLQALQWCDEIIVVDSGSTDTTIDICQKYGCKIFYRPFDGYGEQKRFAVSKATHQWILSIDADEILTEALQNEIQEAISHMPPDIKGIYIPRTLVFMEKELSFGNEYKKPVLRLFDKGYGNFNRNPIHEKVELKGKTAVFKHHMLHFSYKNLSDYLNRLNTYTGVAAVDLFQKGKDSSKFLIALRLPVTFFKIYIVQGCFLNGYRGFIWALFSAFYPVVKYAKLKELQSNPMDYRPQLVA